MNFTQKSLFTIFGKFAGSGLALITSIFLARALGPEGLGQYQLLITTQVIAITFLTMGFGNSSIYFINNKKIEKSFLISNNIKFFTPIVFFFIILFLFCIYNFNIFFGQLTFFSCVVFALGAGSLILYNLLLPVLYIDLEVVKIQFLSLLSTVLFLTGIFLMFFVESITIKERV